MKAKLIIISLLLSACFQTRPVEPPDNTSPAWVPATDYIRLLDNLKAAIAQRNVQNYLRCFNSDSLIFDPAAQVYINNESIWDNWSINDEQAYLNNVFSVLAANNGSANLSLIESDLQDVSSDSLRYVGNYSLNISHGDTSLTELFRGQTQFMIKRNEFDEWEIHDWQDIETRVDSSWSRLKLNYIQ